LTPLDISVPEMLQFIQASNRSPEEFPPSDDDEERTGNGDKDGDEVSNQITTIDNEEITNKYY
jgi:hypothetical protein